jgi:hypothetical protein
MPSPLDTAVRTLLLPVKPGTGGEYGARAEEIMDELGVAEDKADWVILQASAWEHTGTPSPEFRSFVQSLLYSPEREPSSFIIEPEALGDVKTGNRVLHDFSRRYFELHARVMEEEKVGHQAARRVLSYVHTMLLLASGGRMTASRIYSILLADGITLSKSWSTPRFILDACGLRQEVSSADIEAIYNEDLASEPGLLGDMTLEEAVVHVAEMCQSFGYDGDLRSQLTTLLIEDKHTPYLCMLHFQLSLLQLYNHRLTNGYEFSPRGEGVLWLTEKYNAAGLNVGLSPFLNNAKSVDTLNEGWASSKKKRERHAARSLTDILAELDRLSDPSRSAAGVYLRGVLHRIIRISSAGGVGLPHVIPAFDVNSAASLLASVGIGNTGTRGIIEQRLTDSVVLYQAGDLALWRKRGFGDSVFTTNTARKKFGDAELKHVVNPLIVAAEAHGGRLTEKYVQEHLFTMRNVLPFRVAELEDRAPLVDWTIQLQFYAHEVDPGMTESLNISGVSVEISYVRFSDLAGLDTTSGLVGFLDTCLRNELNKIHVHPSIRQALLAMM